MTKAFQGKKEIISNEIWRNRNVAIWNGCSYFLFLFPQIIYKCWNYLKMPSRADSLFFIFLTSSNYDFVVRKLDLILFELHHLQLWDSIFQYSNWLINWPHACSWPIRGWICNKLSIILGKKLIFKFNEIIDGVVNVLLYLWYEEMDNIT